MLNISTSLLRAQRRNHLEHMHQTPSSSDLATLQRHFSQKRSITCIAMITLAACTSHTSVQRGYVADRDGCQVAAESNLASVMRPEDAENIKLRNAKLVTLFSDCMFQRGWTVATPSKAPLKADPGVGVGASIRPGRDFVPTPEPTQNPQLRQHTPPRSEQRRIPKDNPQQ